MSNRDREELLPTVDALVEMLRTVDIHGHWSMNSTCRQCAAIAKAVRALGLEVYDDADSMRGFILPDGTRR